MPCAAARDWHNHFMRTLLKTLAGLAILLILGADGFVAANWAPDKSVAELSARWAQPPSQFVRIEGMNVHLRDEGPRGDPTPIVLIHGTSSNLHTWDAWASALVPAHRVIRMDLPGFGLTGPAPDGDYTPPRYARFILDVLDNRGVKHVILAGNSLGGGIAWMTAATEPGRVAKLILLDAAGYPTAPASVPLGFRIAQNPWLRPILRHILPRSMVAASLRNVYADPSRVTPGLIDQYYDMTLREGNREALGQRMTQGRFDLYADKIAGITQPTLILWGAEDHLIPPANAVRFKADIKGSLLTILPHLGHVPMEEGPAVSLAAVTGFIGQP